MGILYLRAELNIPQVLNDHVNENYKKIYFVRIFFSSSKKLNFHKENMIFLNTFLNFN